jgi:hypothetical protein
MARKKRSSSTKPTGDYLQLVKEIRHEKDVLQWHLRDHDIDELDARGAIVACADTRSFGQLRHSGSTAVASRSRLRNVVLL